MAKTTEKVVITAEMIDELAALREQIASLAAREKELRESLRKDCDGVDTTYRGRHYVLKTKFVTQERLNTALAREVLGEEWCSKHTKTVVSMNIDHTEVL